MKRSIALAIVVLASPVLSSFAGEPVASWKNPVVPPPAPIEELYRAHEFQIDIFGAYAPSLSDAGKYLGNHAWGGGAAVKYFFTQNLGIGLGGSALRATGERLDHSVSGQFGLDVIGRLPIGNSGWAPYVLAGVGGFIPGNDSNLLNTTANAISRTARGNNKDDILLEGHAGLGVEYRFNKNVGIFTDGHFTLVNKSENNYGEVRTGVRFAF